MEQQQYRSGLPQLAGFQPKKRAKFDKQRQAFAAQAERNQRQQSDTIRENTAVNVANAKQSGADIEALAKFSTSLTKQLVEGQKKKNEEEKQKGIMDVYENGMDTTEYDEGVEELREVDRTTEAVATQMEKNGADVFLSERVRNASGWRAYGQVIGKAQLGAANYPAFLEAAKADTEVIITDEDGNQRPITFASATEPEEFAALQAEVRSSYLKQFSGINPAVLNEYLFPDMRRTDALSATTWSRERAGIIKQERQITAISDFENGARNISDTYTTLVNSGVAPGDARTSLINLAADLFIDKKITQAQFDEIKASPFGPGGTWGSANARAFEDAIEAARGRNVESTNLENRERQIAYDEEVNNVILPSLQDGNYSQDQLDGIIKQLAEKYRGVRPSQALKDFYDNSTIEGRTSEELNERLDSLYASGELTVRELNSGRYSGLTSQERSRWLGLAQQSEQLGSNSNEMVAAAKTQQEAIEQTIRTALGAKLKGDAVDPSATWATEYALGELNRRAKALKVTNPDMTWGTAMREASKELVAEIRAGIKDDKSDWFVSPGPNRQAGFQKFTQDDPAFTSQGADQTINGWKQTAKDEGKEVFNNQQIFTAEDAKVLSNPNNGDNTSASIKLATMVRKLNDDEQFISMSEARQMVLDSYGLKRERPFETDELEETALDQDMLDRLYSPYASGPNSVAVQANTAPPVIRTGVEGGRDVIQASVAFGAPPQLAPLAAAVMANETGWGKYTSGKNNLFNIKSTDGTGTNTMTLEGDVTGGRGVLTPATWRDYKSGTESVRDFWQFLRENSRYAKVLTSSTPMEALRELKAAGYATAPDYVQNVAATWGAMGIDPNKPFQPRQLGASSWANTSVMSPNAQPIVARKATMNAARTSTGMDTSAGPDAGNNACVWAVNAVLQQAGIQPPWGDSVYVPDVKNNLDQNGTRLSGPEPGAIVIMQDNGSPPYPHIGIVQEDGTIISNSSSRASFDWVATASEYEARYGRKNLYYSLS